MIELHAQVLEKKGRKEFIVLPYEEFLALRELAEDAEDTAELRLAVEEEGDSPTITLDEVRSALELSRSKRKKATRKQARA